MLAWGGFWLVRKRVNANNGRGNAFWRNKFLQAHHTKCDFALWDGITSLAADWSRSTASEMLLWSFWNTWAKSVIKVFLYNCLIRLVFPDSSILLRKQWQHLLSFICSLTFMATVLMSIQPHWFCCNDGCMKSSLLSLTKATAMYNVQRLAVSSVYSRVARITVFYPMLFWDYWRASHTDHY